ncbi:hypothetical protein BDF19DRAFT_411929 [Syncephalis fuscata]|nr:hypothetical protein BDF19DRAFT_411929 [Syncephalis fuscata]
MGLRLLDGEEPHVGAATGYYVLFFICEICIIASTILFYRQRHDPSVWRRAWSLTVVNAVSAMIMGGFFLVRTTIYPDVPCWISRWIISLTGTTWALSWICRIFYVIAFYRIRSVKDICASKECDSYLAQIKYAQSKLMAYNGSHPSPIGIDSLMSKVQSKQPFDAINEHERCQVTGQDFLLPITTNSTSISSINTSNNSAKHKLSTDVFYKHRNLCTVKSLIILISIITACLALIIGIFDATSAIGSVHDMPSNYGALQDCTMNNGYIPLFLIIGIAILFIAPILGYLLYNLHDPYRIRTELYVSVVIVVCAIIAHFGVLFSYYLGESRRVFFSPSVILVMGCIFTHGLFVFWPTITSMLKLPKQKTNDISVAVFRENMQDPRYYAAFKAFAADEYSIDNVIFYRLALAVLVQNKTKDAPPATSSCEQPATPLTHVIIDSNTIKMQQLEGHYVRIGLTKWMDDIFFAKNAPMEANISVNLRKMLHIKVCSGQLVSIELSRALAQVEAALYTYALPRFINSGFYPQQSRFNNDFDSDKNIITIKVNDDNEMTAFEQELLHQHRIENRADSASSLESVKEWLRRKRSSIVETVTKRSSTLSLVRTISRRNTETQLPPIVRKF